MKNDLSRMISKISLEEKVSLVVGRGMPGVFGNPPSRVEGAAGETRELRKHGIPSIVMADGPAGLRIKPVVNGKKRYATSFPIAVLLASSWNDELVERVGKAMGREALNYGVDIILAPALNIQRNPLCGRNFEYYSEDPVLSGRMAYSFVIGVQSNGVGACLKHFVANNQETNRRVIDVVVSEKALREIYLKGFEIALKSKPWTIMNAYNKLNGHYCSENEWLLTRILRDEWKFDGLVMTDWFAGVDPVKQISAGTDLIMPGRWDQFFPEREEETKTLLRALKSGRLKEEDINRAVLNILRLISKTPTFRKVNSAGSTDLSNHADVAYESAVEGMILLKNEDDVLPIDLKTTRIALFGVGQIETVRGGTGSGYTYPRYVVSILDGFKERSARLDGKLVKDYEEYIAKMRSKEEYRIDLDTWPPKISKLPEMQFDREKLEEISSKNDIAIVVISRISGEGKDRELKEGDYYLSPDEVKLLRDVYSSFHRENKKVLVILNIGSQIDLKEIERMSSAILLSWQAGQETGRAVVDVVSGVVSPSGKLPLTFARNYEDYPSSKNFPGEPPENPEKAVYDEGTYVGYRFFDAYNVEPMYEFGFGLSYTRFDYDDPKVELKGGKL
ncbi:MAG: glycoside hydrolase family 3 protein, partial [Thermotogae bacterium]|nr:glycoside hydrolase family 3 protein [Thermotogota bacterium]